MAKIYDTAGSKENPVITKEGLTQYHVMIGQTIEDAIGDIDTSQVTQNTTDIESLKSDKADKSDVEFLQSTIEELQSKGGSASLTIRVECDTKYEGKTFTATSKSDEQTYTAVADEGVANISIPDSGTYTVTNDLDALSVEVEVENPLITLAEFYEYTASIRVTLPSSLVGSTITCKLDSTTYKIVALSTSVTFAVHKTGEWTVGVDGNSYIKTTVEVTDDNKSYTAELKVDAEEGIPKIEVTTDSKVDGKVIKCKKDKVTLQQTATNKACTFLVPSLGVWTLTCDDFPEKEVTVNVAEAKTYKTRFSMGGVYTLKIDKNATDATNRMTYIDDAEGMTPASVSGTEISLNDWADSFFFEKIYPVMLRADGTEEYKLNPNDYSQKFDGSPSQVAEPSQSSNAMVCIEKMYTKFWSDDYYEYMSITDGEKDGYSPLGFQDANGNELDKTYIAMYLGSFDVSSHLRSLSGQSIKFPANTQSSEFNIRTGATGQGANYGLASFAQYEVLNLIFNLIFKTEDCTKLGQGRKGGGENTNSLGTLPSLKTGILNTSGPIGVDTASGCVKFMHVEDFFSNRATPLAEMIDGTGVTCSGNNNGKLFIKGKRPYGAVANNGNVTTTDYKSEANFITTTGNIKTSVLNNEYGRVPSVGGATSSTFECDGMAYDQYSISGTKIGCRRGGIRGLGSSWFGLYYDPFNLFRGSCCARLSYEPLVSA